MFYSRTKRKSDIGSSTQMIKATLCILLILFLLIKILDIAAITWLWVFSPIWIPCLGGAILLAGATVGILIKNLMQKPKKDDEDRN